MCACKNIERSKKRSADEQFSTNTNSFPDAKHWFSHETIDKKENLVAKKVSLVE